jgi:hypothetical protein
VREREKTRLRIELARRIIIADIIRKVPLHTPKFLVPFLGEFRLEADHGLEAGVEEGYTQVEELGELCDELLVQNVEYRLGLFVLFLGLDILFLVYFILFICDF